MRSPVVPQLFVILEGFIADGTDEVLLVRVYLHVGVVQPTEDRGFEIAQVAGIELHVNRVFPPEMRVKCVPIAKFLRAALRAPIAFGSRTVRGWEVAFFVIG